LIGAIILAAGEGKRMKRIKPLVKIDGKTMLEMVIDKVKASKIDERILVLGYMADTILSLLNFEGLKVVINRDFSEGMASSLALGIKALDKRCKACLIFLGDKPFFSVNTVNQLIDIYNEGKGEIILPKYKGERGHPVLFDKSYFKDLVKLKGDMGAKALIEKYKEKVFEVDVEDEGILIDIDTEEDLKKVLRVKNLLT